MLPQNWRRQRVFPGTLLLKLFAKVKLKWGSAAKNFSVVWNKQAPSQEAERQVGQLLLQRIQEKQETECNRSKNSCSFASFDASPENPPRLFWVFFCWIIHESKEKNKSPIRLIEKKTKKLSTKKTSQIATVPGLAEEVLQTNRSLNPNRWGSPS